MDKVNLCYVAKRSANAGARTIDFVISNGKPDRDGDTINPLGWHLENYKKNPVVLWGHQSWSPPIGKCTAIEARADGLYATAQFATKDENEVAETVYRLLAGGYLNSVSVGFKPLEWSYNDDGRDFKQQELLEFSVVTIPANPDAFSLARSKGIDLYPIADGLYREIDHAAPAQKPALAAAYLEARKGRSGSRKVYDPDGVFIGVETGGVLAVTPEYKALLAARNLDKIESGAAKSSTRLRVEAAARAQAMRVRTL